MDDQIVKLAEETLGRYNALTEELSDPDIYSDQRRYREVAKEHARLRRGAELCQNLLDSIVEMREAQELVPGAESALFAGELHDMYTRYADRLGFKHRTLASSPAEVGGYREVTVEIEGDGAYSILKHEGGTHRVQRVPKTESQGRIHTSTATVAVLPEAEDVEIDISPGDLEIDVYRSSGPGGQSVNTTDSAVRITHKPTGLVVTCQNEKSQLQNKEQALRILRSRLLEREMRERREQEGAMRLAQVGTGDRSAKVRTYNFPQGRITDHRVGVTSHNLEAVLNGELDDFTQALAAKERADKLAAEAAGTPG